MVRVISATVIDDEGSKILRLAPGERARQGTWVSVVIGRNGTGKSRLLAGIGDSFLAAERGRPIRRKLQPVRITVSSNRTELSIVSSDRDVRSERELPAKVVAVATTPFDKFSSSTRLEERYSYIGLRANRGQVSARAAVFQAVERLFDASLGGSLKRSRIAGIFRYLGYYPDVTVGYRVTHAFGRLLATEPDPMTEFLSRSSFERRFELRLERDPDFETKVHSAFAVFSQSLRTDSIETDEHKAKILQVLLHASFESGRNDSEVFEAVQVLVSIGALTTRSVTLRRIRDDREVDLMAASSGELAIVTAFLGIASVIEDESVVLIDEPEVSLHPEWQVGYIEMLLDAFGSFSGCHYIVATHSPLVLSDLDPARSTVLNLDDNEGESPDAVAQRSSDELLATVFNAPGNGNLFIKQRLIGLVRALSDPEASTDALHSKVSELEKLLGGAPEHDPGRELVASARELLNGLGVGR